MCRCFRAETGGTGAASRGLYRLHQFSKVELAVICLPEQSNAIHDELLATEEELVQELGFSYRVLDIASEDLGAPAHRKFDIEAWMPGRQAFGEVHIVVVALHLDRGVMLTHTLD